MNYEVGDLVKEEVSGITGTVKKITNRLLIVETSFGGTAQWFPTECSLVAKVKHSPTKPSHYHEGGIDVFAYMQANFTKEEQRGFHKGTAIKYISRAGKKKGNSYEQDIAKAKVHIEELERLGEEG